MVSYQVDILNPKAKKILQGLADLTLITLSETSTDPFLAVVGRLRKKASAYPISLDEITQEVEAVRAKRYARKTKA